MEITKDNLCERCRNIRDPNGLFNDTVGDWLDSWTGIGGRPHVHRKALEILYECGGCPNCINLVERAMISDGAGYMVDSTKRELQEKIRKAEMELIEKERKKAETEAFFLKSIADINQFIQRNPQDGELYVNRAFIYTKMGKSDLATNDINEAIRISNENIRLNPENAKAYFCLGRAYPYKKDFGQAIKNLSETIRLDKNFIGAYNTRGSIYSDRGEYNKAIADFKESLRIDPSDNTAIHLLENATKLRKEVKKRLFLTLIGVALGSIIGGFIFGIFSAVGDTADARKSLVFISAILCFIIGIIYAHINNEKKSELGCGGLVVGAIGALILSFLLPKIPLAVSIAIGTIIGTTPGWETLSKIKEKRKEICLIIFGIVLALGITTEILFHTYNKDGSTERTDSSPSHREMLDNPLETFTDPRDNQTYKTVKIGPQTWFAENLNYNVNSSACYDNNPANCQRYGRLYNWSAAIKACPSGWHLPSNAEWDVLYRLADGSNGTSSPYKSETAGEYLKAKGGWNSFEGRSGNGTDDYNFAALPGGVGNADGKFFSIGNFGNWWSSSEYDDSRAYNHFKSYKHNNAGWETEIKSKLFSVRCLQGNKGNQVKSGSTPGKYPQASERILTDSDLQGLSKPELRIMRNEIFARHGYIFKSDDLKEHFGNQNWYAPKYADVNSMLTTTEQKNIKLIQSYE